jgi:hypothetical protein
MPRRACPVTQASIARALRAVRQLGMEASVRLEPDGAIVIIPGEKVSGEILQAAIEKHLAADREAVL